MVCQVVMSTMEKNKAKKGIGRAEVGLGLGCYFFLGGAAILNNGQGRRH